jgi:hypothetical protein
MRHLSKSTEKDFITFDNSDDNNQNNNSNNNKYEDFSLVEKKLNEILAKNLKQNQQGKYSEIPIRITLHSHHCINGVIIDLPGFPEKEKDKGKKLFYFTLFSF